MEVLVEYVNRFLPNVSSAKDWCNLFSKQNELGIVNIIHIAEIGLAMPLSNAETECTLSFGACSQRTVSRSKTKDWKMSYDFDVIKICLQDGMSTLSICS